MQQNIEFSNYSIFKQNASTDDNKYETQDANHYLTLSSFLKYLPLYIASTDITSTDITNFLSN